MSSCIYQYKNEFSFCSQTRSQLGWMWHSHCPLNAQNSRYGVRTEYVIKNGQDKILRLPTAKFDGSIPFVEKLRSSTAISETPQEAWQTAVNSLFYRLSGQKVKAFLRSCWHQTTYDFRICGCGGNRHHTRCQSRDVDDALR